MNAVEDFFPHVQMIALAVNVLLVLFILPLRRSIEGLQKSDDRMNARLQALEIKLAERYVQRDEITGALTEMDHKLERIENMVMNLHANNK